MSVQSTSALIVIDVQNDFCSGGALAVPEGEAVVAPVNAMMGDFGAVVLTQDWHPEGHSSFASQHPGQAPLSEIAMPYGPQVLWPDHCIRGTQGADFHPGLNLDPADLIIRKGYRRAIDSYSAFFENDHQTPTGLDGYLRSRGIGALTLVGLAYDFCVFYSAVDAARLGYQVTVVTGATRGIDFGGSALAATKAMQDAGVTLS